MLSGGSFLLPPGLSLPGLSCRRLWVGVVGGGRGLGADTLEAPSAKARQELVDTPQLPAPQHIPSEACFTPSPSGPSDIERKVPRWSPAQCPTRVAVITLLLFIFLPHSPVRVPWNLFQVNWKAQGWLLEDSSLRFYVKHKDLSCAGHAAGSPELCVE